MMLAPILSGLWNRLRAALIGVDDTALAVVAGSTDLTISARCGLALIDDLRGQSAHPEALFLGYGLDELSPGHCFGAILGDMQRAQQIVAVLGPYADYIKASGLRVS